MQSEAAVKVFPATFFARTVFIFMPTAMPIDKRCRGGGGGGAAGTGGTAAGNAVGGGDNGNLWSSHKTHNQ